MRILIVDDNDGMRAVMRSIAERTDEGVHELRECRNGAEAVVEYALWHPDAVVMDIDMPVMDGLAAAREICRRDAHAVIVHVTQWREEEYREHSARAGAVSIIGKERLTDLPNVLAALRREQERGRE
ncbi:MAG: response regulator [Bacteroidetes bacterium]|nr:response regulator [Bacteroidota bacterium]